MVLAHQAKLPLSLAVHDELSGSHPNEKSVERLADCMRDSIKLMVPVIVKTIIGKNWGECG